MEKLLTADEAAKLLQLSPRTVVYLAAQGKIPGRKIGCRWRFVPSILEAFAKADLPLNGRP